MNRATRRVIYILLIIAGLAVVVHIAGNGLPDLGSLNPHVDLDTSDAHRRGNAVR